MHRIKYTRLTPEQISGLLAGAQAPAHETDLCGALCDEKFLPGKKLRIVTDGGPTLEYQFSSRTEMTFSENGGTPVPGFYGAKTLPPVTLFTHLIPGAIRGYAVAMDWSNRQVTVFDLFFGGEATKDAREVQREIYYGYFETEAGGPAPEKRHTITNRFEGKCLYWKDDTGAEELNFYPSVCYSSFVRLGTKYGDMTYCAPTDYIKLSEDMYVYARVEAEFSGLLTLQVVGLLDIKQVGLRLGFDENDKLIWQLFAGDGEITGQLSSYEDFTDKGTRLVMAGPGGDDVKRPRGYRPVYRPLSLHPVMTAEEVRAAAANNTDAFAGSEAIMSSKNLMPYSTRMTGKTVKVRYDNGGPCWEYRFDDDKYLSVRAEGQEQWDSERYEAFEPASDMVVFSHMFTKREPNMCNTVVLDIKNSLTTCVHAVLGNRYAGNEVDESMIFGVMEGEGCDAPKYVRHHATDELVGKSFTWNYSDEMNSIHVYSTPNSYSWTIFLPNNAGGLMWSSPCLYGKLRDDTYMFSWVEEACNGSLGVMVFNTRLMHDCGFFYGADKSSNSVHLHSMGAYARHCGVLDIKKHLGAKA